MGVGGARIRRIGRDIRLAKQMLEQARELVLAGSASQRQEARDCLERLEYAMERKREHNEREACSGPPAGAAGGGGGGDAVGTVIGREREWWDAELRGWREQREKEGAEQRALAQLAEQTRAAATAAAGVGDDPIRQRAWLQEMEGSLAPFLLSAGAAGGSRGRPRAAHPRGAARRAASAGGADGLPHGPERAPRQCDFSPRRTRQGLWSTVPRSTSAYVECRRQTLLRADWNREFRSGRAGAHGMFGDQWWEPAAAAAQTREEELRRVAAPPRDAVMVGMGSPRRRATSPARRAAAGAADWRGPLSRWETGAGVPPPGAPPPPGARVSRVGGFDLWSRPPPPEPPLRAARPPDEHYKDAVHDRPFVTHTGLVPTLRREAHDRFYCKP